jgi:hypothetical protein
MKKRRVFVLMIVLIGLIAAIGYAASGDTEVYITKSGEKYHTERCTSVRNSKIAITLERAVSRGFEACKRCKPPVLD